MPKLFLRIVAFSLTLCLIADPVTASALLNSTAGNVIRKTATEKIFDKEAFGFTNVFTRLNNPDQKVAKKIDQEANLLLTEHVISHNRALFKFWAPIPPTLLVLALIAWRSSGKHFHSIFHWVNRDNWLWKIDHNWLNDFLFVPAWALAFYIVEILDVNQKNSRQTLKEFKTGYYGTIALFAVGAMNVELSRYGQPRIDGQHGGTFDIGDIISYALSAAILLFVGQFLNPFYPKRQSATSVESVPAATPAASDVIIYPMDSHHFSGKHSSGNPFEDQPADVKESLAAAPTALDSVRATTRDPLDGIVIEPPGQNTKHEKHYRRPKSTDEFLAAEERKIRQKRNPFPKLLRAALKSKDTATALEQLIDEYDNYARFETLGQLREERLYEAFEAVTKPFSKAMTDLEKGRDVVVRTPLTREEWTQILYSERERSFALYRFMHVDFLLIQTGTSFDDYGGILEVPMLAESRQNFRFDEMQIDGHSHPYGESPTPSEADEQVLQQDHDYVFRDKYFMPVFILSLVGNPDAFELHLTLGTLGDGYTREISGEEAWRALNELKLLRPSAAAPAAVDLSAATETFDVAGHSMVIAAEPGVIGKQLAAQTFIQLMPQIQDSAKQRSHDVRQVLDLGTGRGTFAIALGMLFPSAHVVGTDVVPEILQLAQRNAEANGVGARFETRQGDLLEALREGDHYDIIMAGLPSTPVPLDRDVRNSFDPHRLLEIDGGSDGRNYIDRVIEGINPYMAMGGALYLSQNSMIGIEKTLASLERNGFKSHIVVRTRRYPDVQNYTSTIVPHAEKALGYHFSTDEGGRKYYEFVVIEAIKNADSSPAAALDHLDVSLNKKSPEGLPDLSQQDASALKFYRKNTLLQTYTPKSLQETLCWLVSHRAQLANASLAYLVQVLGVSGKLPRGESLGNWQRSAAAYDFYLGSTLLQGYQPRNLVKTLQWLHAHREKLGNNSLRYLVQALELAGEIPSGESLETWHFFATAYDFYLNSTLLQRYKPRNLVKTLQWLHAHREKLGNNSLGYLIQVLGISGKLPPGESLEDWQRSAGAYDFYLGSTLLQGYQPRNLVETLQWLHAHRDKLGNNSLGYLIQVLGISGKLPPGESLGNWQRSAAAYDFYLGSTLLQGYQPLNLGETLQWLHAHRSELGNNSLVYLVQALGVAGKIPAGKNLQNWQFSAGAFDRAVKEESLITNEFIRIRKHKVFAEAGKTLLPQVLSQFSPNLLKNLKTGKPLSRRYQRDVLYWACELYPETLITHRDRQSPAAPSLDVRRAA